MDETLSFSILASLQRTKERKSAINGFEEISYVLEVC